jgi:hypothetical protein
MGQDVVVQVPCISASGESTGMGSQRVCCASCKAPFPLGTYKKGDVLHCQVCGKDSRLV